MKPLATLQTVLVLGRVSNLPTVWTNTAAGWFLAGGAWTGELGWLLLGMSLVYLAGMALNDAFDAEWDRRHAPGRPIPSGRIGERTVWALGAAQLLAGAAALAVATTAHPALVAALAAAVLLYNWLHKRWSGSVLLMGLCRGLVYLAAGSAVAVHTRGIEIPGALYGVAAIAVLYVSGLTLTARQEHRPAPPALRFGTRLLLTTPVLLPLLGSRPMAEGPVKIALVVGGILVVWAWVVIVRTEIRRSVPRGVALAIAGIALYDASLVVFADWRAAALCLVCFGGALLAQRFIPAT